VTTIPEAYLKVITPLVNTARGFLENGEALVPVAFVGNFASGTAIPVMLNSASDEAKDQSAEAIRLVAEQCDADFIFVVMEAWSLRKDKLNQVDEILDRYGSIGASPYAVDVVSLVVETRHGVWVAQVPVRAKGYSKKKRTFGEPVFQLFTEVGGRFVDLLPKHGDEDGPTTLH
jgi:hypothetical protein